MDRQSESWITRKEQKDIKRRITNAAHSNPSKLKKNNKDGKMLTRIARRRRRIVNQSLGSQDMSERSGWGEVGSELRKRRENDRMKGQRTIHAF